MEIDFIKPVAGDQEITIQSVVREFQGPDAHIECTMTSASNEVLSRCLMTVACVDKDTNKARDWPEDVMALFFKEEP